MDVAALIRFPKQRVTAPIQLFIINIPLFLPEIDGIAFLFCENAFLDQGLQTDKIRISRNVEKD